MNLKNVYPYPITEELSKYMEIYSFVKLNQLDIDILYSAMLNVSQHKDFFNQRNRKVFVLLNDDDFNIGLLVHEIAIQANMIFIDYTKFQKHDKLNKLIIVTEELVHHFWDTDDEPVVKPIVMETIPHNGTMSYDSKFGYTINRQPIGLV